MKKAPMGKTSYKIFDLEMLFIFLSSFQFSILKADVIFFVSCNISLKGHILQPASPQLAVQDIWAVNKLSGWHA